LDEGWPGDVEQVGRLLSREFCVNRRQSDGVSLSHLIKDSHEHVYSGRGYVKGLFLTSLRGLDQPNAERC
jgi:hypothetical protein